MVDKKESARLTMGLNYWNFCTASFLAYCLAQASPSPSLQEKGGKANCLFETIWLSCVKVLQKVIKGNIFCIVLKDTTALFVYDPLRVILLKQWWLMRKWTGTKRELFQKCFTLSNKGVCLLCCYPFTVQNITTNFSSFISHEHFHTTRNQNLESCE